MRFLAKSTDHRCRPGGLRGGINPHEHAGHPIQKEGVRQGLDLLRGQNQTRRHTPSRFADRVRVFRRKTHTSRMTPEFPKIV